MRSERAMRRAVCEWLAAQHLRPVFEVFFGFAPCDLVGVHFAERVGRLIPPVQRVVAVELKLDDIACVLRQCENNAHHVPEVYAAMPVQTCDRMRQATVTRFFEKGIGLLAVGAGVKILVPSMVRSVPLRENIRRALWRRRDQWRERLENWEKMHPALCAESIMGEGT